MSPNITRICQLQPCVSKCIILEYLIRKAYNLEMLNDIDWRTATVGDAQEACGIARNTKERRAKRAFGYVALGVMSILSVATASYALNHPFVSIETRCLAGQPVVAADIWSARRIEVIAIILRNSNNEPLDSRSTRAINGFHARLSARLHEIERTHVVTVSVLDTTGNISLFDQLVEPRITMCQTLPTDRRIKL